MIRTACLAVALAPMLGACSLFQGAYDQRVVDECRDIVDVDQRRACEQAADQTRWEREAKRRAEAE